jgi:wyosine [tRNA(Phe)-imidazoG37] synthetase (radical SAM superfamily)
MDQFEYKGVKTVDGKKVFKINILPEKRCNFDCVFCPIGRSPEKACTPRSFEGTGRAMEALAAEIRRIRPDIVFINSKGEALLHGEVRDIIRLVQSLGCSVRLLTNGYLLGRSPFRETALSCEEIFCEIKAVSEESFQQMQRPAEGFTLREYIENMAAFRKDFRGKLIFEVTLIRGCNDDDASVQKLCDVVRRLSPDVLRIARMDEEPFCRRLNVTDARFEEASALLRAALL